MRCTFRRDSDEADDVRRRANDGKDGVRDGDDDALDGSSNDKVDPHSSIGDKGACDGIKDARARCATAMEMEACVVLMVMHAMMMTVRALLEDNTLMRAIAVEMKARVLRW